MKLILLIVMCSATANECMPPKEVAIFNSHYHCMMGGYSESMKLTQNLNIEEVNKHKIYFNFVCKPTEITES